MKRICLLNFTPIVSKSYSDSIGLLRQNQERHQQRHRRIAFKHDTVYQRNRKCCIDPCCWCPLQAWHGNLSCVKALVGGGARLNQLNRSGLTAREALLNAGPTFSRGRPPNVVRATLKYMECAEVSSGNSRCYLSNQHFHSRCCRCRVSCPRRIKRSHGM